jgi:hypothetical protein
MTMYIKTNSLGKKEIMDGDLRTNSLLGLDEGNLVPIKNKNSTSLTLADLHAAYIMKRSLNQLAILEAQAGKGDRGSIEQLIQIAHGPLAL